LPRKKKIEDKKQQETFIVVTPEAHASGGCGKAAVVGMDELYSAMEELASDDRRPIEDIVVYRLGPRINVQIQPIISEYTEPQSKSSVTKKEKNIKETSGENPVQDVQEPGKIQCDSKCETPGNN
jgi:hypothetical protein